MRLGAAEATRNAFRSLCNLDSSDKALQVALLFATEVAGRPLARVSAMNLDFDRHAFRRLRSIRLSKPTQQSACHALSHCNSLCISACRTVMPSLCATCCRTLVQCTKKWLCRVRAAQPRRADPAPNCQFCRENEHLPSTPGDLGMQVASRRSNCTTVKKESCRGLSRALGIRHQDGGRGRSENVDVQPRYRHSGLHGRRHSCVGRLVCCHHQCEHWTAARWSAAVPGRLLHALSPW